MHQRFRDAPAEVGEFKGHQGALFQCKSTGLCWETNRSRPVLRVVAPEVSTYRQNIGRALEFLRKWTIPTISSVAVTILFINQ